MHRGKEDCKAAPVVRSDAFDKWRQELDGSEMTSFCWMWSVGSGPLGDWAE